jgi:hypothetical protein
MLPKSDLGKLAQQSVTKFVAIIDTNSVTPKAWGFAQQIHHSTRTLQALQSVTKIPTINVAFSHTL